MVRFRYFVTHVAADGKVTVSDSVPVTKIAATGETPLHRGVMATQLVTYFSPEVREEPAKYRHCGHHPGNLGRNKQWRIGQLNTCE